MNLSSLVGLKKVATKVTGRSLLIVRKHSPEILTTIGVIGVVAAGVLASKATLKLEPIVDQMDEGLDHARDRKDDGNYSDVVFTKEVARVYVTGALDVIKLYGPSVTLGLSSIACIVGAHGIMRKRTVAITAAYKTLEQGFSEYRKRVIEELGEDKDRDFRFGIRDEKIVDENGKTKKVATVNPNGFSQYARFFDELNKNWEGNSDYNLLFLKCQQNMANDMLHARGHLFLNEVYDSLGLPRTSEGSVVGWVLGKDGDNFVDFGIYDLKNQKAREFVNGYEKSILLDFNVDGLIFEKI